MRMLMAGALAGVLLVTACVARARLPLQGHWVIRDWACPGVCAMDSTQAQRWVGKTGDYSSSAVRFAGEHCDQPEYREKRVSASEYARGFNLYPRDIGITSDSVRVVAVDCGGKEWTAPGSSVAIAGAVHLTWWDGIMFTLTRR